MTGPEPTQSSSNGSWLHFPGILYGILGLFLVLLFWKIGSWGVTDPTEGRYAEIAREMLRSGDFLHPEYLGIQHYHKPPVTYWITAFAYKLFGINAFAVRFFLQVAIVLQVVLVFAIGKLMWEDRNKAIQAVFVYISFLIVWISARSLSTDAYLNTAILAAFWAMLAYARKTRPYFLYLAALFAGLGFLTKITALFVYLGPIAISILYLYRKQWRWSIHVAGAVLLFFVIAGSWFGILEAEGFRITEYALYKQSVVRYISDTFGRSQPPYFYLVLGPALALPWSLVAIHAVLKLRKKRELMRFSNIALFAAGSLFPFVFFNFSGSKLILYILPAYPLLALMTPAFLGVLSDREVRTWYVFHLILCLAGSMAVPVMHANGIIPGSAGLTLAFASTTVLTQALLLLPGHLRLRERVVLAPTVFTLVIAGFAPQILAKEVGLDISTRIIADWVTDEGLENRQMFMYNTYAPSFAVHVDRTVNLISENLVREMQFEQNDTYKSQYFDLSVEGDSTRLVEALRQPSLLIYRKNAREVPDTAFLNTFAAREEFGSWYLYY